LFGSYQGKDRLFDTAGRAGNAEGARQAFQATALAIDGGRAGRFDAQQNMLSNLAVSWIDAEIEFRTLSSRKIHQPSGRRVVGGSMLNFPK
jgi:hypothetical protein